MPRTVWAAFVLVVLVAAVLVVTDTPLHRPGVTAANVARIQPGMTMPQVEALLGGPCDVDITTGSLLRWDAYRRWEAAGGTAAVSFEGGTDAPKGRVQRATFTPADRKRPLDRLRVWLGFRPAK
jgi:SmpA / OmlA family